MDRNKIDSEIKALQSGFAGNDAIYMGKRNGIEVGYLAAVKKYEGSIADLQAKCERYEKALNEIMDKSIDPDNDDAPAATLYGINLAATEALAGDGEKEVGFDYKSREFEKGKPATEEALKRMHDRWRITGERVECECGLWIIPEDGCRECKNQKEDGQ
jgi:hypothetical protein